MLHIDLSPCLLKKKKNSRLDFSFQLKPTSNFFIPFPKVCRKKSVTCCLKQKCIFSFFSVHQQPSTFFFFSTFIPPSLKLSFIQFNSNNCWRRFSGGETRFLTKKLLQKYFFCHLSNWPTSKLFWERL